MKQKTYEPEVLDRFRAELQRMGREPKPRVTSQLIVHEAKDELRAALGNGYSLEDVVRVANESGFTISEGWLRRLLVKTSAKQNGPKR